MSTDESIGKTGHLPADQQSPGRPNKDVTDPAKIRGYVEQLQVKPPNTGDPEPRPSDQQGYLGGQGQKP